MASLAELMVTVGADISEFTRNMQKVDQSLQQTGRGIMSTGRSISDAGVQMGLAVTTPLLAIATTAVMIGAKFDAQMSRVQAISGATSGEFEKLRAKALELGASTTFSSTEVAQAMEQLASAGFNTSQIMNATAGVLNLASSAGIGLAEASQIAGSAINGFGLQASDAGHVADVLAKASAISATNATGLGDAFKYVAPVAKTLGISLEETAGAIGLMANAGIDGSQAGTTLRMGLLRLASPTKEMTKLMEATGSQFFDSSGKMKNLAGIIDTLRNATKNMTDEQKTSYLATLFGAEAVSGFMVLIDQGSGKLNEYTNTLKKSDGEAQKMADTMNNNLMGAWNNLTGALESLAISFSDVMKGDLQNLANKITDLVNWFTKLDPATKKVIVVIGLLVASIAPLLIVIGFIAQGVGALVVAFGAISAPIAIAIGVIVAVGVALLALWQNSQTFRDGFMKVFDMVKAKVTEALGAVVTFLKQKLDQIQQFWAENGTQILQAIHNVWDFIAPIIQVALQVAFFIIEAIWSAIKGVIDGALNIIMGLIKIFAGLFTGDFSKMWEGVKQLFFGAIEFIWNLMSLAFYGKLISIVKDLVKGLIALIKGNWETIKILFLYGKDAVVNAMNGAKSLLISVWNAIKSSLVNTATAIWNGIKSIFSSMGSGLSTIWNGIKSVALAVWNALKGGLSSIVNGTKSVISSVWNGISSLTSSVFNSLKSTAISIWNGLKSGISTAVNGAKSAVSTVWNGLSSLTSSVFNGIRSTAISVWNGIKSAITNPIQTAKNTVLGIISSIKNAFASMKITIPRPHLPQIEVTVKHKNIAGVDIPYPSFSFHAKGGIFNGATLLGGNNVVGEAGAEAVIPLQNRRYMAPFAQAIADNLDGMGSGENVENHFHFSQGAFVVREEADIDKIAQALLDKQKRTNRGGGR
jgi:TP901 family phage tail tape measure protein